MKIIKRRKIFIYSLFYLLIPLTLITIIYFGISLNYIEEASWVVALPGVYLLVLTTITIIKIGNNLTEYSKILLKINKLLIEIIIKIKKSTIFLTFMEECKKRKNILKIIYIISIFISLALFVYIGLFYEITDRVIGIFFWLVIYLIIPLIILMYKFANSLNVGFTKFWSSKKELKIEIEGRKIKATLK